MPNFVHTKVDPDRLKVTADNIRQSISSLDRAFQAVEAANGNLSATWRGPASQQFFAQYEQDKKLFKSHMKVLASFNDQLREAAGIFDGADTKARELVNQLRIG